MRNIYRPQSRAEWFKDYPGIDLKRRNFAGGWNKEGDLPMPGVRVCLIGTYNEAYDPIAELVEPNWHEYCLRHGYALRTYPGAFHLDPSKPQTYGDKIRFSLYYDVKGMFDIVVMLDIDSVFVDLDMPLWKVLMAAQASDADKRVFLSSPSFLWTYGEGGPMSGLWIARTDEKTEKHLRYAYEYAAFSNNVRHGKIEPNGISDQDAMTWLMRKPPFEQTFGNCVDAESIGFCFPDTKNPKPWIVTAKGGSVGEKLQTLHQWSAKIANRI